MRIKVEKSNSRRSNPRQPVRVGKIVPLRTRRGHFKLSEGDRRYRNDFSEIFFMNTNVLSTSVEPSFPQKNRPTHSHRRVWSVIQTFEAIRATLLPFCENP